MKNKKNNQRPLLDVNKHIVEYDELGNPIEVVDSSQDKKERSNKETNYYLQQRYLSAEMNTDKISFEPDKTSRIYSDNSQDYIHNSTLIKELDDCLSKDLVINKILKKIPKEKTVNLPLPDVNKLYAFCMILLDKNEKLSVLSKFEMLSLLISYLNLNEKETKYFYSNLSVKFKSGILNELEEMDLYKDNKLF